MGGSGLPSARVETREQVRVQIADSLGNKLGLARGTETIIDGDAAGLGWFVDPAPSEDEELVPTGDRLIATNQATTPCEKRNRLECSSRCLFFIN